MTTVIRILAVLGDAVLVILAVDLALLGLILAAHWWRRNDACSCGCGALNDYDGGDVYDQELAPGTDFYAWERQIVRGE